jgi:hypothetical protein
MTGRNILMYFPWSRPDGEGAPLGSLNNRFGALFEHRSSGDSAGAFSSVDNHRK